DIVEEVKRKYHVYFVVPGGASHGKDPAVLNFWEKLVGTDRVIVLQSPDETSECIALAIGINEGVIDRPAAVQQMQKRGVVGRTIESITAALQKVFGDGAPPGDGRNRRL